MPGCFFLSLLLLHGRTSSDLMPLIPGSYDGLVTGGDQSIVIIRRAPLGSLEAPQLTWMGSKDVPLNFSFFN